MSAKERFGDIQEKRDFLNKAYLNFSANSLYKIRRRAKPPLPRQTRCFIQDLLAPEGGIFLRNRTKNIIGGFVNSIRFNRALIIKPPDYSGGFLVIQFFSSFTPTDFFAYI